MVLFPYAYTYPPVPSLEMQRIDSPALRRAVSLYGDPLSRDKPRKSKNKGKKREEAKHEKRLRRKQANDHTPPTVGQKPSSNRYKKNGNPERNRKAALSLVIQSRLHSDKLLVGDRWEILGKIGTGNYGDVFEAKDVETGSHVAVKLASTRSSAELLMVESGIYRILNGASAVTCVPVFSYFGPHRRGVALVIDLLGSSLYQLKRRYHGRLSLKSALMIGIKLVGCLSKLHGTGILHRDIKPDNILIGKSDKSAFFLVDFGLASTFRLFFNGRHMSRRDNTTGFVGTARYASLNIHNRITPTRRDDLISLGYTLIYLYKGSLPWQNVSDDDPDREVELVGKEKSRHSFIDLCSGMGEEMEEFFQHLSDLPFAHKPDYVYLIHLLERAMRKAGLTNDSNFEWNS